jgi:hypothetical protein
METEVPTLDDVDRIVTDEVINEYWERGYWVGPKLFSDDEIQRLRRRSDRLWSGKHDYPVPSMYGWIERDLSKPDLRQQGGRVLSQRRDAQGDPITVDRQDRGAAE